MTKQASVPPGPSQELLGRGAPVLERPGDCLTCHRSAVRNWGPSSRSQELEDSQVLFGPPSHTLVLRFSLVSRNQP